MENFTDTDFDIETAKFFVVNNNVVHDFEAAITQAAMCPSHGPERVVSTIVARVDFGSYETHMPILSVIGRPSDHGIFFGFPVELTPELRDRVAKGREVYNRELTEHFALHFE